MMMVVRKAFNISAVFKNFGILGAVISGTLIQSRAYLLGYFYGDPFDGRLMVVLHEHWWHFLRGERPFLNTYFFFPFDRGLGFSDTFFLQGIFYSIARAIQFDLVDSWALATIGIFIVSNIGLALLARQIIKNYALQLSFIIISASSFTFFAFLNMSPNVAGYGLVTYLGYFFAKLFTKTSSSFDRNLGLIGITITFPMLLLSAWYAAFFSAVFIFLYFLVSILINLKSLKNYFLLINKTLSEINLKVRVFSALIFLALTSLWLYIYLPVAGSVDRELRELQEGSIKLSQLPNGASLGGGIFKDLYQTFGYTNFDTLIQDRNGLTLTLFITWVVIGIFLLFYKSKIKYIKVTWVVASLQVIIFTQFENYSIFQFFFESIPGLSAIRVPARILILISGILILLIHLVFDELFKSLKGKSRQSIIALSVVILPIIFIDQIRFETVSWQKDDYVSNDFYDAALVAQEKCESFYLNSEGEEWWDDQLSAMIISAQLNFPTINGYSGGYPAAYPSQPWRSVTQINEVIQWLSKSDALNSACLIRNNSVDQLSGGILTTTLSGFDFLEKLDNEFWWWSKEKDADLSIINLEDTLLDGNLSLVIERPDCQENQQIKLTNLSNNQLIIYDLVKKRTKIQVPLLISPYQENILRFSALVETCSVNNDPRTLFFSVKNPVLS